VILIGAQGVGVEGFALSPPRVCDQCSLLVSIGYATIPWLGLEVRGSELEPNAGRVLLKRILCDLARQTNRPFIKYRVTEQTAMNHNIISGS